jgi:hypothetical protein
MADLTTAGVSITRQAYEIRSNGLTYWEKAVTVTLSTNGSATATELIPASAFGLTTVEECSPLTKTDDTIIVVAAPSNDKTFILLKAAGTNAPASVTGAYKCVVKGY